MSHAEVFPLRRLLEEPRIATNDGIEARVQAGGDVLCVSSPEGVLFTYDARTGKATVHAKGELRVAAESGDLELAAQETVRITGKKLEMRADETELESARLSAKIDRGRMAIKELFFGSERVESVVQTVSTIASVVDLRAGRVVERVRDSFREVEGVAQTRAQRVRTVATETYQLLSGRATLKAERDLALHAEKIELA